MTHPKLAALAVVMRDQKILLVQRKNEPDAMLWGYPGGHVDYGETVGDAACRELFEETTVRARPSRRLAGLDTIIPDVQGKAGFHFYLVPVICTYVSGEPQARDDVLDAQWVAHQDVFEQRLPLSKDVDTVLKWALH